MWRRLLLVGGTVLLASASAWAGQETSWFSVAGLEAKVEIGEGYRIYPDDYTLPNPKGCSVTSYAEVLPTATAVERDLMNKTLLAGFLAGRRVKLAISQNACSSTNAPAYYMVRLSSTQ